MDDKFNEWAKEYFGVSDEQLHTFLNLMGVTSWDRKDKDLALNIMAAKAAWIAATKAAGEK